MTVTESLYERGLREHLRVVARRKKLVVLCALLAVVVAVAWSSIQTPLYSARAEVLLRARSSESLFDPNTGARNDPVRAVQTEIGIIESQEVRDAARERLGSEEEVIVQPMGQTDLIEIQATDPNPERAAEVANTYADVYIEFRRIEAVDDTTRAANQIRTRISELQNEIDGLERQIANASDSAQQSLRIGLAPQRDSLLSQQALFRQKLEQLQVEAALQTGGARLVTRAAPSTEPISPKPVSTGIAAAVAGTLLGVGLAFVRDYTDDSLKSKDDLEQVARGVPVIGLIPAVRQWKRRDRPLVVSSEDPKAPSSEAYRTLRTSIQTLSLDRPMRTLLVTSARAGDGKTTTVANLAIALERAGHRVVIVCADLRRPRLHDFFGVDNSVGFTSVLLDDVPLSAALQPIDGHPLLSVLASGPLPQNPSEFLSQRRVGEVLLKLEEEASYVLIDSPPVLPVSDALVLAGLVDAVCVVSVSGATTKSDVERTVELLQQVDAPLVGTVLNGVSDGSGGGYKYQYRYGSAEASSWTRRKENGSSSAKPGSDRERQSVKAVSSVPSKSNGFRGHNGGRPRRRSRLGRGRR